MKDTIYVIGHKNPDADAICSAFAYAKLKSLIDKHNIYVPVRCGRLNKQTQFIFQRAKHNPPVFINDVYPRVKDLMTKNVVCVDENDPLFYAMKNIKTKNIRLTPIVDEEGVLKGIVSVFEITDFFIGKDVENKPLYRFIVDNCIEILDGYLYKKGANSEFEAQIIIGAMPFFRFREYLDKYDAGKVIVIVGKRSKIINYSLEKGVAALILTGITDKSEIDNLNCSDYKGHVILSGFDTAETARRLTLSTPAKAVMKKDPLTIYEDDRIDQVKEKLSLSDVRGLPVISSEGKLVGILTRSDIIKKHSKKVILIDHNESTQAVDGIETVEIMEIVDHHRLGTIKTKTPIHFCVKPIGSTSTLVFELYRENGVTPEATDALILLSGILSDTIILKSPTTTHEDVRAAEELARIVDVDVVEYGREIFSNTDSLRTRQPEDIVEGDFKIYEEYGVKFGIGQVEVVNLEELSECKDKLFSELDRIKTKKGFDWIMLLVTDIVKEDSMLLTTDYVCQKRLPYQEIDKKEYYLPNVLSRKKQLLPVILGILEGRNKEYEI